MIVPGLPTPIADASQILNLSATENDVDVFARLGSPTYVVHPVIYVQSGVVIGSSDAATAALIISGFASGSTFTLINEGRISGKGGDGGVGDDGKDALQVRVGTGGGGGAGASVGIAGPVTSPATLGTNGSATLGGHEGANGISGPTVPVKSATEGEDGGDAISCGAFPLSITNANGEIWGGGGGGHGALWDVGSGDWHAQLGLGGSGGDIAEDCENIGFLTAGFAGYAVRGSAATFVSGGSDPNVKGTVGV